MRPRLALLAALLLASGAIVWLLNQGDPPATPTVEEATDAPPTDAPDAPPISATDAPTLEGSKPKEDAPKPGPGTITGRVLNDADGSPIGGAKVFAFLGLAVPPTTTTTDADGNFTIAGLRPLPVTVTAWHPRHAPLGLADYLASGGTQTTKGIAFVMLRDGHTTAEVTLRLAPGRLIRGRVVDETGAGVPDTAVTIGGVKLAQGLRRLGPLLSTFLTLRTDKAGGFELSGLPSELGEVRLGAWKQHHAGRWSEPISTDASLATHDVELQLVRAATVSGTVRMADGVLAAGSDVLLLDPDPQYQWVFAASGNGLPVVVEADGTFAISGIPPETNVLSVNWRDPWLEGPDVEVKDLKPGEHRSGLEITIPTRYVLRVRLTDASGAAVPGERISICQPLDLDDVPMLVEIDADRTDEEGRVGFALAERGPFTVRLESPGRMVELRADVRLPTEELQFEVTPSVWSEFDLRVLAPDGLPVTVYVATVRSQVRDERPDEDHFETRKRCNPGRGKFTLRVQGPPPYLLEIKGARILDEEPILRHSRTTIESVPASGIVEVRLESAGRLTGQVIDQQGEPVPGVQVTLETHAEDTTKTDLPVNENGVFEHTVPREEGARYRVHVAVPPGYLHVEPWRFRRGDPHRVITLEKGGTISGRVVAPAPLTGLEEDLVQITWAEEGALSDGWMEVDVDETGRFVAHGVPLSKNLTVEVAADSAARIGLVPPPPLTGIRAGQADIELTLREGLQITGRIVLPKGVRLHQPMLRAEPTTGEGASHSDQVLDAGTFKLDALQDARYRLRLIDRTEVGGLSLLVETQVKAGTTGVTLRVPRLGSLEVTLAGTEEAQEMFTRSTVNAYVSGTTRWAAHGSATWTGGAIAGLPTSQRYDLTISHWSGYVGRASSVAPGDSVTIELVEGVMLAGQITTAEPLGVLSRHRLLAKGAGCCFKVFMDDEGSFEDTVMPGTYDLILVKPDASERVLARGVKAGAGPLNLTLK